MLVYCKKSCRVCGKSPQKINHIKQLSFSKSRYNQTPLYGQPLKTDTSLVQTVFFISGKSLGMRNSYCNGFTDLEESEDEKRRKKCGRVLPAKNRRAWTASFTLMDQCLDPGSPGGFRQPNYYKTSPLRNFFVILTFQNGDKRVHC